MKFFMRSRLKFKSFEPLTGFVAFVVQKLWLQNIQSLIVPDIGNFTLNLPTYVSNKKPKT